jgi:hypothetical protein
MEVDDAVANERMRQLRGYLTVAYFQKDVVK